MKRISDKMQIAVQTILNCRDGDEIAYAYCKIVEFVREGGIDDIVTSVGEKYIELADEM